MSIFEIAMLICFGFAWPTSIYKSLKSKSIEGKSVIFLYIILIGYMMGMAHKVFYNLDFVIILYGINFIMVLTDLLIYYNNKRNVALKEN